MSAPQILISADGSLVAAAVAARLITKMIDIQAQGRIPAIVLTGGTVGIESLAAINGSAARDAVDWGKVELFWGDERFVAAESHDRNEKQASEALLADLALDPALVHVMAPSDGEFGDDLDAAAGAYSDLVAGRTFDVTLLGLGPDGHVASLFPGHPGLCLTAPALAVRNSPKPPPERISLSLDTIRNSTEVWIVTAGSGKADAVRQAFNGATEVAIPAVGAVGRERTLWMLDAAAAVSLPSSVLSGPRA